MAIRMFRYGFEMALEEAASTETGDGTHNGVKLPLVAFPRQVVLFLEENDAIGESVAFRLQLPNQQEIIYEIPAIRYWLLTPQDLQWSQMYALLPLQVFKARKKIRAIAESVKPEEEKQQLMERQFADLKEVVHQTVAVISDLHNEKLLPTRDMDRLLRVMNSMLSYLYQNYGEPYHQTEKEVFVLIKSLYDPVLVEKGKAEGRVEGVQEEKVQVARRMLSLNIEIKTIELATELPVEEIEKLRSNDKRSS